MSKVSTKSQKRVDQLLAGLVFVGILIVWFSIFEENWLKVALGVSLASISGLLFYSRIEKRVHTFVDKIMGQMEMIKDINSTGFKVYKLDEQTTSLYQWKDVDQVILKNKTELVFKFQNNNEKIFDTNTVGYYRLLKNIPKNKLNDTFAKSYQRTTFENLTTCPFCGYIAFKNTKCLSCITDSLETAKYIDAENESDYLRAEQLDYFCTDGKGEPVEFYPKREKDDIFEFDKNWKPIVTEKEVVDYSRENYWD